MIVLVLRSRVIYSTHVFFHLDGTVNLFVDEKNQCNFLIFCFVFFPGRPSCDASFWPYQRRHVRIPTEMIEGGSNSGPPGGGVNTHVGLGISGRSGPPNGDICSGQSNPLTKISLSNGRNGVVPNFNGGLEEGRVVWDCANGSFRDGDIRETMGVNGGPAYIQNGPANVSTQPPMGNVSRNNGDQSCLRYSCSPTRVGTQNEKGALPSVPFNRPYSNSHPLANGVPFFNHNRIHDVSNPGTAPGHGCTNRIINNGDVNRTNNSVANGTFIERLNQCLNRYDLNQPHNTNHNRYPETSQQHQTHSTSAPHIAARNSSNNSSMSSKNSLPSSSHNNNFHQSSADTLSANPIPNNYQNQPGQVINGILRNSVGQFDSSSRGASNNNSTRTNSSNPEREKVVRIDPNCYNSDEGPAGRIESNPSNKSGAGLRGILLRPNSQSNQANSNVSSNAQKPSTATQSKENSCDRVNSESQDEIQNADIDPADELRKAAAKGDLGKIQTLLGKPPGNAAGAALVNNLDQVSN